MLSPTHFRNVNEALDALFNLYKCTVVRQRNHFTFDLRPDRIFQLDIFPRMRQELFHAEGDTLLFLVEIDDDHIDGLIQLNDL